MKFYIDSKAYFWRDEKDGAFSIVIRATNQTLHLNRTSRVIFERPDEWIDFEEFVRGLGISSASYQRLWDDYSAAVFRLHACGAAKLEDVPTREKSGCSLAEPRDYYHLSKFCRENFNKGFSMTASASAGFYGFYNIYDKIQKNDSLIAISWENGEITACLIFSISKRNFGGVIVNLDTAIFNGKMSESEAARQITVMLETSKSTVKGKAIKLRYEAIHPRQNWLASRLLENGFEKTLTLPEEIETGQDLTLYDFLL